MSAGWGGNLEDEYTSAARHERCQVKAGMPSAWVKNQARVVSGCITPRIEVPPMSATEIVLSALVSDCLKLGFSVRSSS
jgi:hypothetical protein